MASLNLRAVVILRSFGQAARRIANTARVDVHGAVHRTVRRAGLVDPFPGDAHGIVALAALGLEEPCLLLRRRVGFSEAESSMRQRPGGGEDRRSTMFKRLALNRRAYLAFKAYRQSDGAERALAPARQPDGHVVELVREWRPHRAARRGRA